MVWFCHDVIYGKAKHVVELGADWNIFSWVVCLRTINIFFEILLDENELHSSK